MLEWVTVDGAPHYSFRIGEENDVVFRHIDGYGLSDEYHIRRDVFEKLVKAVRREFRSKTVSEASQ